MFKIEAYTATKISEGLIQIAPREYQDLSMRGYIMMRKSIILFDRLEKAGAPAGISSEAKAKAAKKLKAAGATRWITVHPPDGDKSRQGVPVMVKDHGDGTAHVVGGAGGRLNMLKLRGLKTPEEYHAEMRARRQEEREKKAEEKRAEKERIESLPEHEREKIKADKRLQSAAEQARKAEMKSQEQQAREGVIEAMAKTLGWQHEEDALIEPIEDALKEMKARLASMDKKDPEAKTLGKQIEKTARIKDRLKKDYEKALVSKAKKVAQQIQDEALHDPEVKEELQEAIKQKIVREEKEKREDTSKGFSAGYKESSKEKGGLTEGKLAGEKKETFERRMDEISEETDPRVAMMIRAAVQTNREYSAVKQDVLTSEFLDQPMDAPEEMEKKAEIMKAYLELRKVEKRAKEPEKKELKQIDLNGDTEDIIDQVRKELDYGDGMYVGGLSESDFSDALEAEKKKIENEEMAALNTALLDRVDENDKGRLKYTLNGVYNGLNSAVLAITKQEGLNRDVVDVLGLDNAARLTARVLAESLSDEDYEDARVALEEWHAAENEGIVSDALAQGEELLAKAEDLRVEAEAMNPDDLHAIELVEKQREVLLDEASRTMAQALGSLEATAALSQAMKDKRPLNEMSADLGDTTSNEAAIVRARALGLQDGEYEVTTRGGHKFLNINVAGVDRIRPTIDRGDVEKELAVARIKSGEYDEDDWVPSGLKRRVGEDDPDEVNMLNAHADTDNQRLFDGDTGIHVSTEAAHRVLGETPEAKTAWVPTDELSPSEKHDLRMYWEREIYTGSMAEGTAEREYKVGKGTTRKKEWNAFLKDHDGDERAAYDAIKADLIANHSEEDMFGGKIEPPLSRVTPGVYDTYENSVPGAKDVFDQFYDLKMKSENPDGGVSPEEFKRFEKELPGKLDGLLRSAMQEHAFYQMRGLKEGDFAEGGREERSPWGEYVRMHGGPDQALQALQDIVRSKATQKYVETMKNLGVDLKTKKTEIRNARDHVLGLLPKDARDSLMNRVQAELASAGARTANRSGGKFAAGSWRDKAYELIQRDREEAASQGGLFGDDDVPEQDDGTGLVSIGSEADKQLGEIMGNLGQTVRRGERYGVAEGFDMSGAFADKQRAIKMFEETGKMNLTFGTGKGKSVLSIGAYAHLHSKGKVKRAVFAVPSVVQAQFGSEINKFAEPGKYKWFNTPGVSREERIAALRDPENNMVMMTHQSLRDDMVHLMSTKMGVSEEETKNRFNAMGRDERKKYLKETMAENGINFDMGVVDESHYTANRKGKADTTMSNVIEAITDNTPYFMNQSATPVKNDASEAFDMLSKVDPGRFNDRSEFLKRYGVDTEHSRESLQRLINRYNYARPSETGVKRNESYETVDLTQSQKKAYQGVEDAARRASKAARRGEVDVEAMRTLSPNSFKGVSPERHEEIARKLQPAVGTIKEEALNRAVNQHDWRDNGKISKLMDIVSSQVYSTDHKNGKAGSPSPGVVFAHNLQTVDNIVQSMKSQGLRVGVIQGSMSGADKEKVKVGFNPPNPKDRQFDVVVLSDAGATGLNLQNAKYLVNFDQPHTSWVREQRMGRIDRHGQSHDEIDYYDVVTDTPHEKKKIERVRRKARLGSVFQTDPGNLDDTGLAEHIQKVREARRYGGGGEEKVA